MKKLIPARRSPARRPAPARRPSPSRALVRRPAPALVPQVLPATQTTPLLQALASDPIMSAAFVGTLTLTGEQIRALRRPVEDVEIEWRPLKKDGPPAIPYLSHNGYRDRLDAAFGLGGWGMAPVGQPKEKDGIVYVPYALVVGGVPRIYAWGEQEYHASNKQMTFGDALEGAKSNAITRCGKELGVARELWNRRHLAELKVRLLGRGRHASRAEEPPDERVGAEWSATDWPADAPTRAAPVRPPSHTQTDEPISQPQRRRLGVILRNSGRDEQSVRDWLRRTYGHEGTATITRQQYDAICAAIEAPADLPERRR